ncbi:uncharacterized protein T551_01263 [Pneumocystis jirovecii RU7]|uniref:P-loop containing nucleoside triphosphate hydrolase protein n=1 Tax=Pneumocystis jirovecii (strain RU7) TaxID=1408657 RepID=A0A0W4ZS30_PNEJ7|nr:uncharacterized protein T551_01263 [Pneumocystis jirovecii RU7]KTW31190.1 hypothetical protein T551_01263 [Pneumocystis jirovecii RU7]
MDNIEEKEKKIPLIQRFRAKMKYILLGPVPSCTKVIPEAHANIFSRLIWSWLDHLIVLGYKRPLEATDLWYIDEARSSENLDKQLYENYERRKGSKYALLKALKDTYGKRYFLSGLIKVVSDMIIIFSTVVIKYIIIFSQKKALHNEQPNVYSKPNIAYGIMLCFTLYFMQTLSSFCLHHSFYQSIMIGAMSRTALISCIYRKSLAIKNTQRLKFNNGKIMNLINTDVTNIDTGFGYANIIWTSVIQTISISILLFLNLGISTLAGLSLIIVIIPILAKIAKNLVKKNLEISAITDIRVRLTNEMLQSIKVIKFYTWEKSFLKNILGARLKEAKSIKSLHIVRSIIDSLSMNITFFCIIVTFITYYKIKNSLEPSIVFSSLTLLNHLRIPLMLFIYALVVCSNMLASIKRIDCMLSDEDNFEQSDSIKKIQDILKSRKLENSEDPEIDESNYSIVIKNGYFAWPSDDANNESKKMHLSSKKSFFGKKHIPSHSNSSGKILNSEKKNKIKLKNSQFNEKAEDLNISNNIIPQTKSETKDDSDDDDFKEFDFKLQLKNINLKIKKGELVCIVGPIGSGKSTLLLSIINETYKIYGTININGTIGYCSQVSWIQNSTVMDNILFGKPYDKHKYQKVINVCCLDVDIQTFANRDLTEIGEKGVTLSGGQKQRINIARSVYFDADIILLDDSLSSVDSNVSKDIFEKCIRNFLKDKTVIFVTHHLNILSKADKIVYLENGEIMEMGKYSDLINKQEYFYHFVEEFIKVEEQEEETSEKTTEGFQVKENEFNTLMQKEEREIGSIKWIVYIQFIRAAGGLWLVPVIILLLSAFEFVNIGNNLWLSFWSKNQFQKSPNFYIFIYLALGVAQTLLDFIIYYAYYACSKNATTNMHHKAVERVIRAPMLFFDTTPLGRIINKFTKDIKILDNSLADSYLLFSLTSSNIVAIFILITVFLHYFSIPLIFLLSLFFVLMSFYRVSSREVKRLDSLQKSDLYAQISETLTGLVVIRAYGEQLRFKHENEKKNDISNSAYFLTLASQRWLTLRLDAIGNMIILSITILSITSDIDATTTGLILSYCLQIVSMMSWMLRQFAEVEINMNSVERLHHYADKLGTEAPLVIPEKRPPPDWPQNGEIIFNDVWLKYREELPYSLKGLNIRINKGEKVGIVGRTGAGKSSIMVALYRLVELSKGSIIIDGICISEIGLHDLRSKLSIIPQEPTLFEGTIRSNLDPFNEYTDQEVWDSLERSWFLDSIKRQYTSEKDGSSKFSLESPVEIDGQNFSLGQRQLLTMARALLRKSKIIIFDEATSSIDARTELKIQNTIQNEFKNATLLCIGNRIKTVINYDTIIVIDSGTLVESGSPQELFNKQDGVFRSLCFSAGITNM